MKNKANALSLLPIGVFLILYLGLGILLEYVMKIEMGFYNFQFHIVKGGKCILMEMKRKLLM